MIIKLSVRLWIRASDICQTFKVFGERLSGTELHITTYVTDCPLCRILVVKGYVNPCYAEIFL